MLQDIKEQQLHTEAIAGHKLTTKPKCR